MEEQYNKAKEAFEQKDFVEALKLFSEIEYLDSKALENKCIDALEDLIYYSKKKKAVEYLERLSFYKDYNYFLDAYKRRRMNLISKILMFGSALIGTIILIIVLLL
ncbi:MAG: hypothetical protein K2J93_01560 [Anaeroplasmataceae bacterium]|nr:hypothetical protein [Anaeroplasmataceae bacterium]